MTQQQPAKKKTSTGGIVLGVVLVLALCGWIFGRDTSTDNSTPGTFPSTSAPSVEAAAADPVTTADPVTPDVVIYKITGSASSVDVTYQNADDQTTQDSAVGLPWTMNAPTATGSFVYISAQNQDDSGTVTCEIDINGVVAVTNTSTGAYVIASCDGRL